MSQNKNKNENNNNSKNKDNIVVKLKRVMIERDPFNSPGTKETDLLGYFVGALPTMITHPDDNLED